MLAAITLLPFGMHFHSVNAVIKSPTGSILFLVTIKIRNNIYCYVKKPYKVNGV